MHAYRYRVSPSFLLLAAFGFTGAGYAETETGARPDTGLKFWRWQDQGVLLELTQRLPDQTRGFFQARGFDKATANRAGTACIFQSMFRNVGAADAGRVDIDLTQWRVVRNGTKMPMLLREDWEAVWQQNDVAQASRIAFEWSLLPTRQSYDPQDYNWGMTSYGLPPGSTFDLEFSWTRNGKLHHGRIRNIECPEDIHPNPPSEL